MRSRVFQDPPALIGHRGFGKNAEGRPPENTVESFVAAAEAGVDWIELDVRRTADDQLAVLHDPMWPDGTVVVEHPYPELAALGIASLDEALDAIPATVGVDIEIKPSPEDALVSADQTAAALLCPVLNRVHGSRPLLVSSFDPVSVTIVKENAPQVPTGLITWMTYPLDVAVATAAHLGVDVLMAHTATYDQPTLPSRHTPEHVIEIAQKAELELAVWSPDPAVLDTYVQAGVDAITVDDVPGALAVLRRNG